MSVGEPKTIEDFKLKGFESRKGNLHRSEIKMNRTFSFVFLAF